LAFGDRSELKGVLFDKDGTLIDFQKSLGPIIAELAHDFAGGDPARALELMLVAGLDPERGTYRAGSAIAAGTSADICDLWCPGLDPATRAEKISRISSFFTNGAAANPWPVCDLHEVLDALARDGYRLGVATNDTYGAATLCLKALEVWDRFDAVYGWDSVPSAKPAPDMIHAFCDLTGLHPAQVVMVGDNMHDMETGLAAGVGLKVAVLSGNSTYDEIAHAADLVLPDISHLPAALRELRGQAA
jgi:phosphoglycolate phosphatase